MLQIAESDQQREEESSFLLNFLSLLMSNPHSSCLRHTAWLEYSQLLELKTRLILNSSAQLAHYLLTTVFILHNKRILYS